MLALEAEVIRLNTALNDAKQQIRRMAMESLSVEGQLIEERTELRKALKETESKLFDALQENKTSQAKADKETIRDLKTSVENLNRGYNFACNEAYGLKKQAERLAEDRKSLKDGMEAFATPQNWRLNTTGMGYTFVGPNGWKMAQRYLDNLNSEDSES